MEVKCAGFCPEKKEEKSRYDLDHIDIEETTNHARTRPI